MSGASRQEPASSTLRCFDSPPGVRMFHPQARALLDLIEQRGLPPARWVRDRGVPLIGFQLLIYPATDMHCPAPSHAENELKPGT
jgi:hypothetical protein